MIKDKTIKDTQAIYIGEDAKWLVGNEKIPEYLTTYLKTFLWNAEEFRINSVRYLRTVCLELVELCNKIPESVFGDITNWYSSSI